MLAVASPQVHGFQARRVCRIAEAVVVLLLLFLVNLGLAFRFGVFFLLDQPQPVLGEDTILCRQDVHKFFRVVLYICEKQSEFLEYPLESRALVVGL